MLGDGNYLINITKEGYRPKQIMVSAADGREEIMVLMDKASNCATINGWLFIRMMTPCRVHK